MGHTYRGRECFLCASCLSACSTGFVYSPLYSVCSGWRCQSCRCLKAPPGPTDPASPLSLAAQAVPQPDAARYCLRDSGGRVAVYTCRADGTPGTLIRVTGIYTNLLPENDALRIKRGLVVNSPRELDLLLEDLGE